MKNIFRAFIFLITGCFVCHIVFAEDEKAVPNYTIKMVSPKPEETFQNDAQSITVQLSITPALAKGDNVVVYVDGAPTTDPQNSTSIALPYLERGSHTLQAKIIQQNGSGAETDPITIYQQRVSKLLPAH